MGQVACGLFGVWALIKRRKCRGERVHEDVAPGEERRKKNKPIRNREQSSGCHWVHTRLGRIEINLGTCHVSDFA